MYPEMIQYVVIVLTPLFREFYCDLADIYRNIFEIWPVFLLTLIEHVLYNL